MEIRERREVVYNSLQVVYNSGAMTTPPKGGPFRLAADYHAIHQQLETLLAGTRRTKRVARNRAGQEDD